MTCLPYCLMEPKRDSYCWCSLRRPSLVLCWAESFVDAAGAVGLLWFTSPQRPGGIGLSRRDFSLPTQQVWHTVLETSCSWKGAGRNLQQGHAAPLSLKGLGRNAVERWGGTSQQTPRGRWKPASYGFALWVVERREKAGTWGISSRHLARRRGSCCACRTQPRFSCPSAAMV